MSGGALNPPRQGPEKRASSDVEAALAAASESNERPRTFADVGDKIGGMVLRHREPAIWWIGLFFSSLMLFGLILCICMLIFVGIGIWGVDIPVAWGFAITNFVWWVGIGHAGTLI
jgi:molybdopterin-containing oxidoreductase family membrane subunit